jgi:hypothetical protein
MTRTVSWDQGVPVAEKPDEASAGTRKSRQADIDAPGERSGVRTKS